jgi:hypothetical protein
MCQCADVQRTVSASFARGIDQCFAENAGAAAARRSQDLESRDPKIMACLMADTVRKRNLMYSGAPCRSSRRC